MTFVVTFPPLSFFLYHNKMTLIKTQDVSLAPLQVYHRLSQPIEIPVRDPSSMDKDIVEAVPNPSLTGSSVLDLVFFENDCLLLFEEVP